MRVGDATLTAGLLALALMAAPAAAQGPTPNYLDDESLTLRAWSALTAQVGPKPRLLGLSIGADEFSAEVQDPAQPSHLDRWRVRRFKWSLVDLDRLAGPDPVQAGPVADMVSGLFDADERLLAVLPDLRKRALAYAKLDDPATVSRIALGRAISILPRPAYGDLRWTLTVTSGRETATAYATPEGRIFGGDLAQTNRAQRLNLWRDNDWPMREAAETLRRVVGDDGLVTQLSVDERNVGIRVVDPGRPNQLLSYSWSLSGVTRGLGAMPNIGAGAVAQPTFRLGEIDLERLPALKAAALAALRSPEGRFVSIVARRAAGPNGTPEIVWALSAVDKGAKEGAFSISPDFDERGEVLLSSAGDVRSVKLPKSRRGPVDPLDPATIAASLARARQSLGATPLSEVKMGLRAIEILTTQTENRMAVSYRATPLDMERSLSIAFSMNARGRTFTLAELDRLTPERLSDLKARTLRHMRLDGATVYSITVNYGMMVQAPDKGLVVEMRAGLNEGQVGGRVNYTLEGREIEVIRP